MALVDKTFITLLSIYQRNFIYIHLYYYSKSVIIKKFGINFKKYENIFFSSKLKIILMYDYNLLVIWNRSVFFPLNVLFVYYWKQYVVIFSSIDIFSELINYSYITWDSNDVIDYLLSIIWWFSWVLSKCFDDVIVLVSCYCGLVVWTPVISLL